MQLRDTASPTSASSSAPSKLFLDMSRLKSPVTSMGTSVGTHPTQWSQSSCDHPPKSAALTFAAVWDDERGIITFSSSKGLLEQRYSDYIMVDGDDNDDDSFFGCGEGEGEYDEFQDCGDSGTFGENDSTMAMFQDAFKAFLHRTPRGPRFSTCDATDSTQAQPSSSRSPNQPVAGPSTPSKEHTTAHTIGVASGSAGPYPRRGAVRKSKSKGTLASSTLDGLNVYDKQHQQRERPPRAPRLVDAHYSCFDTLDKDPAFQPCVTFRRRNMAHADEETVSDEGFYESSECLRAPALQDRQYLKSHFSTTTTSTSNYIEVARFTESDEYFSSPLSACPYGGTPPNSPRKVLRKRRPFTRSSDQPDQPRPNGPHGHSPLASSCTSSEPDSPEPTTPVDRASPLSAFTTTTTTSSNSDKRASPLAYVRRKCSTLTGGGANAGGPNHGWVCVEVTPIIKQRVVETP
ncbi:hypothetical protein CONPUDRAFT_85916 [Coniophora puteana RWD-64-598 SS2]|uniref:Uncharacterized protein n=1 Tax=Coniophora puteana (strain RWD-64-598) TaxID=741705 RepID=R7SFG7_CONPW|nr:uncharacterized protein CONPUDRAFT_85916 [Coniophora puteana RWD-64-598 SS2]EIW74487.1 hypothetical protein CONPUDRAFT_85916 [Coniophora puteana RWD-64-598 SS2]